MMRALILSIAIGGAVLSAMPASAATMYVFADPMTLETRRVVVDPKGPHRTYLCMMPPSEVGCHEVKRTRR